MTSAAPPLEAGRREHVPPASGFRRILANLAQLLAGKAGAGAISLVYLLIATHILGARGYGLLILLNGCAVFVGSLVAFSGFHGVVRFGALALAEEDRHRFAAVVRFMGLVELVFGAVAAAVAVAAIALLLPRFGWPAHGWAAAMFYGLAVVGTVRATPQGILQVAGRFDLIALHQLISPVVRLGGALLVWIMAGGLIGFVWAWLASALAEGVAMWLLALPSWRRLARGAPVIGPWRHLPRSAPGFVQFLVSTNFDITIRDLAPNLAPLTIGWMLGPAAAGLYALTQRASAVLTQPAQALGQASYAVFAGQAANGAFDALRRAVWKSVGAALMIGVPIVAAFALFGADILRWLGGGSFRGGAALLVLVGAARLAALAAAPLAAGLTALGFPQRSMTVALVTSFGFYPALLLLLRATGQDGAGWHALLQNAAALLALGWGFAAVLKQAA